MFIRPLIVGSFLLILSGLVPTVQWYMPVIGLTSLTLAIIMGVKILGSQDKDYNAQLELIRLEHLKVLTDLQSYKTQAEEAAARASKAVAELRGLR